MSLEIGPVPAGAAAPLAALHGACFPEDPWDAASLARILALSGGFGYLAWEGEAPAGFLLARDLGGEIEILSLGVLPERRRRGIGGALLAAATAEAARRGAGSLVLEVAVGNAAARRLYAAAGFTQVGRRPRYYRHTDGVADALVLRRVIAGDALPG
ncbi:MAG TPA: GNAT family N-acetyltransferase [Stellaceae bacterium]|nr:GNAT family N-acetyltransferase [Stellaceae bacterium]